MALKRDQIVLAFVALALVLPAAAQARPPAPLSADRAPAQIASTYGSGHFGVWGVDLWGLPYYRYSADERTDPAAAQAELAGASAAQHQLGNDNIKGMAFNDGYTELWSQDLLAQWANYYQPTHRHYAGGYGYLDVGGKTASTLYLDSVPREHFEREFGVGYYRKRISWHGVVVQEDTYAPYGNDPVLLDDVTLTNTTSVRTRASWLEYWDVNPYSPTVGGLPSLGLRSPTWDRSTHTLTVGQIDDDPRDTSPLSIFAASLKGAFGGYETSLSRFFGSGSRAAPAEVSADHLSATLAPASPAGAVGDTLFAFRAPVSLAPGQSVTLRYVYGMAHRRQVSRLVNSYRRANGPENTSERSWGAYLPRANFGRSYRWVARELQWDAYLLRSATVSEGDCGEHTITQGGYYQYASGLNLGTRSWLHYELPMVYSDPQLARELLLYTVRLQPPGGPARAQLPYGTGPFCQRFDLGTSDDFDFWLLNAAAEYGLGTRDLHFFGQRVRYYHSRLTATVWTHLKVAFGHMETYLSGHGDYLMGSTGDWNDFSVQFEKLTESTLVLAQLAYAYPRLAQLADIYGDRRFAAQLRAAGARDLKALRRQWIRRGWYSRGYAGSLQVGSGVIFEEPQPWAILADAPSTTQARALVANIRRYLDGQGAPRGPTKIGSALVPGLADPGVTEHGPLPTAAQITTPAAGSTVRGPSPLQGADEWPGGVWFDPNGWLTWAYSSLAGKVPGAIADAWSEYLRNTLANHATAFPDHWDGTISVDDVCNAYYSTAPADCGNGLSTTYSGQITEQPTWMVMDAVRLAGVTPVADGYDVTPRLPMTTFSLRMPDVAVARAPGILQGYVKPQATGTLVMHVSPPPDSAGKTIRAYADGAAVSSSSSHGLISFRLPTRAGAPANWALVASG